MAERWFKRLLHLFPPVFRREFGDQMFDVFVDIRADADLTTFRGRVRFVARMVRDSW